MEAILRQGLAALGLPQDAVPQLMQFSDRLLEEAHVAVVPGDNFGSMDGEHYIRLSYATSMENIQAGMDRLEIFCQSLSR